MHDIHSNKPACLFLQIAYPETEAEEQRVLHKRRQLAKPLIYLFICYLPNYFPFCHNAKSNTNFMFQFACFHLFFCVSSDYLSSLHRMLPVPSKHCPPCTLKSICITLICIQFMHRPHLLLPKLKQHCISSRSPQSDTTEQSSIDPGAHFADWTDWFLGLHTLNRLQVAYVPERKLRMQTRTRAGHTCQEGQISILATPSFEKLQTINKHIYTYNAQSYINMLSRPAYIHILVV